MNITKQNAIILKVIIYARVSTEEQREEGYSLQEQERSLTRYCQEKDYEIVKIFIEHHSAKTFDRPEFNKILEGLKSKQLKADIFLVTKIDRFSRNVFETPAMLKTLKNLNIKVISTMHGELDYDNPATFFPLLVQSGASHY